MAKVTSKLQVTLPRAVADEYGIKPGDEIDWVPAGDSIRVIPPSRAHAKLDIKARLRLFDAATKRQAKRLRTKAIAPTKDRGWTREELYDRAGTR